MRLLLLAVCLAAAVQGRPEKKDGDSALWSDLKTVLPEEYSRYAEESGLSRSREFQDTVIRKLHAQVVSDTQAIEARQKILQEYIRCSCPKCPQEGGHTDQGVPQDPAGRHLGGSLEVTIPNPFHAISRSQETLQKLLRSCDTELVLETVKLLRINLLEVQRRSQQLAALVSCNCAGANSCKKILNPLVFSIVTGQNDTALERAYWQSELESFPPIMERGIVDTLQSAAANILSYMFYGSTPQHEAQHSPVQAYTAQVQAYATPVQTNAAPIQSHVSAVQTHAAPIQSHAAQPYAGIFAPGIEPQDWTTHRTDHLECAHVLININNSDKKGAEDTNSDLLIAETQPVESHIVNH